MRNVGKDLGVDCWLIKVLDELLHLRPRLGHENTVRPSTPHQSQGATLGMVSLPSRHWLARESPEPHTVPLVSGPHGMERVLGARDGAEKNQGLGAGEPEWSHPLSEPPNLFYKKGITPA